MTQPHWWCEHCQAIRHRSHVIEVTGHGATLYVCRICAAEAGQWRACLPLNLENTHDHPDPPVS